MRGSGSGTGSRVLGRSGRSGEATGHPLLGSRVSLAGGKVVYETVLSRAEQRGSTTIVSATAALVPGAGLAELVRAAGEHCLGEAASVTSLVLPAPLVLPEHGGQRVQVLVSVEEDRTEVTVHSQPVDASADAEWTLHASGEVRRLSSEVAPRRRSGRRCVRVARRPWTWRRRTRSLLPAGMIYGPAFRGLQKLWVGKDEALAEAVLPDGASRARSSTGFIRRCWMPRSSRCSALRTGRRVHLPFAMEQRGGARGGHDGGMGPCAGACGRRRRSRGLWWT